MQGKKKHQKEDRDRRDRGDEEDDERRGGKHKDKHKDKHKHKEKDRDRDRERGKERHGGKDTGRDKGRRDGSSSEEEEDDRAEDRRPAGPTWLFPSIKVGPCCIPGAVGYRTCYPRVAAVMSRPKGPGLRGRSTLGVGQLGGVAEGGRAREPPSHLQLRTEDARVRGSSHEAAPELGAHFVASGLLTYALPYRQVRIVDKRVRGGKLYLRKGVVLDVHPGATADVAVDETGDVLRVRDKREVGARGHRSGMGSLRGIIIAHP